ncbi:hypothetical protein [Polycladomyces subterraneus]|uniref:Uncharacterized protein n=1 Tax=Polycladomyces subterraneus TaxID=1016997 RepID=A0ABT8IJK1_9BACL|nr:hypothetical protein [Polycladomyces subterraneus]MDN4592965.1 hypothetical protein [Polycladomyces subterraneus]
MLRNKHGLSLVLTLTMMLLAIPRLPFSAEWGWGSWFAVLWTSLAVLVAAAHGWMAWRTERERERREERERRQRWLEAQRTWNPRLSGRQKRRMG